MEEFWLIMEPGMHTKIIQRIMFSSISATNNSTDITLKTGVIDRSLHFLNAGHSIEVHRTFYKVLCLFKHSVRWNRLVVTDALKMCKTFIAKSIGYYNDYKKTVQNRKLLWKETKMLIMFKLLKIRKAWKEYV
jgi:hypothetical protein